ncbi:hypothetical protein [Arthrobacter sp. zg-Y769]|uniref:hypothetical protein n=1 Tax=Arthrobacter sp. zg-Y769 TaxID=2894191 RepID=UPI001E53994C|nr:hypothetical protein [Arthrobacter sp. zg-Y769]MCC9205233.1 hypothetical protein [Arthrobacter sp. zg-Y769]
MTNMGNAKTLSLEVTSKRARGRGELVVSAPMAALPPAVERAALRVPKMSLTGVWMDRAEFSVGMTWKSYGSNIVLSFAPIDAGTTRVLATSAPAVPTTLTDWGQSKADLAEILNAVAAEL